MAGTRSAVLPTPGHHGRRLRLGLVKLIIRKSVSSGTLEKLSEKIRIFFSYRCHQTWGPLKPKAVR